jgi:hypothetical protein
MQQAISRHKSVTRWVATAAVLSLLVNVVLAAEVRELRPLIGRSRELARTVNIMKAYPFPGHWLPTTRAQTLAGDSVPLGETSAGRSQVLIYFTVTCPYCLQSVPFWKEATSKLLADEGDRFDVIWVSLSERDSTEAYVAQHEITAPVAFLPDRKTAFVFRSGRVPATVVADHKGRVGYSRPFTLDSYAAVDSIVDAARLIAERTVELEVSDGISPRSTARTTNAP